MRRVKNQKVIRRIADRTRKAGKGRGIIASLAIALTAALFATVFTVGGSMIEKHQRAAMRQVGTSSHAGFKYLTQEEYRIVSEDEKIRDLSCRIFVGSADNKELVKLHTEVSYYEDLNAKMSFCYPETGHMPGREDEIVMSDLTLQALGLPCEIGTKVPLQIRINEKTVEKTFTLCGYYQGDRIARAQAAAVSEAFAAEAAPTPVTSAMEGDIDASDYAGRIMADFNCAVGVHLEGQVAKLKERCGFPEYAPVGVNWAYLGESADPSLLLLIVCLLLVILLSGYLIIYNIFYINVYRDIRYYGLLKTIGMTGKQLRKMVYRQANMLSWQGIPVGLLAGVLAGKFLLPVFVHTFGVFAVSGAEIELKPWVFIGAAAFSYLTVALSCIRPCRIASKASPVEAVRYTEGSGDHSREVQGLRGRQNFKKKPGHVNPWRMAGANIRRNRKKVVVVVASLSMSIILLNSVYTLVSGYDADSFVARRILSDFSVSDATLDSVTVSRGAVVTDGVTEAFLTELGRQEGIEEIGNLYMKELDPVIGKENYGLLEERIFENPKVQEYWREDGTAEIAEAWREEEKMQGKVYGIGEMILDKLEDPEGELDWEKFRSGDYVIGTRFFAGGSEGIDFFLPGEKVTVCNEAGERREYEVLAVADMPYVCGFQTFGIFDCDYILPEEEYLDLMGEQQPMRTLVNVRAEEEEAVEAWMKDYCEQIDPDLTYTSKAVAEAEFEEYKNIYTLAGSLLALILALIGILNFINTMATSVLYRKREFAMMEAVGMTGKQLRQMLCCEGGFYALYTGICSVIASFFISVLVVKPFGDEMYFFKWHFTILPLAVCIPVLLAVAVLVPVICCRYMHRLSVVERLCRME